MAHSEAISDAVVLICWIIIHLIILPYDAYWLYQCWKNRKISVIKKRRPMFLVIKTSMLWLYFLIYYMPRFCVLSMKEDCGIDQKTAAILWPAWWFLTGILWTAMIVCSVGRYWLIFYMIQYNSAVIHGKWQSMINPTVNTENWYLKNAKTWGNDAYIRKVLIIYGALSYLATLIPYFVTDPVDAITAYIIIFFTFTWVIPLLLYVYMLYKIPNLDDDIGIRTELRFSILMMIVSCLLTVLLVILIIKYQRNGDALFCVYLLLIRITFLIGTLKHTRWPIITFKQIIIGRMSTRRILELTHQATLEQYDINTMKQEHILSRREMKHSLSNGDIFEAFMNHLLNEYCMYFSLYRQIFQTYIAHIQIIYNFRWRVLVIHY